MASLQESCIQFGAIVVQMSHLSSHCRCDFLCESGS